MPADPKPELPAALPTDGRRRPGPRAKRGVDYAVICVSTYPQDLARLDQVVDELRARGVRRASRSSVIRAAIALVGVDALANEVR